MSTQVPPINEVTVTVTPDGRYVRLSLLGPGGHAYADLRPDQAERAVSAIQDAVAAARRLSGNRELGPLLARHGGTTIDARENRP
jgi:hypothetical protein